MELQQLFAVMRRRWWLIVIPALVAAVLTLPALGAMLRPPLAYSVGVRLTASQVPTAETARTFEEQSYISWLGSEYAIINLATWMRTDSFAREISAVLATRNITLAPDALRAAITSDSARSIMTFFVTSWPDETQTVRIAEAAIEVLQTKNAAYFAQFGERPARIVPLDAPLVVPVAVPIAVRFGPLLRLVVGLAVGVALAFLMEYLDKTLRSRLEVEALGLDVIGEIPAH
jgi:capsular polysaccharide biosynthesis protein